MAGDKSFTVCLFVFLTSTRKQSRIPVHEPVSGTVSNEVVGVQTKLFVDRFNSGGLFIFGLVCVWGGLI